MQSSDKDQSVMRAVAEKPHDAVVKFDTHRNLQRHRAVLPAKARLLFSYLLNFVSFFKFFQCHPPFAVPLTNWFSVCPQFVCILVCPHCFTVYFCHTFLFLLFVLICILVSIHQSKLFFLSSFVSPSTLTLQLQHRYLNHLLRFSFICLNFLCYFSYSLI